MSLERISKNNLIDFINKWGPASFAFSVSAAFYYSFTNNIYFTVFQNRDFVRVEEILKGQLTFWGPELSGGGHLLGGFYYYLIAPFYAWAGWQGVWVFFITLFSLTATIVFQWALRVSNFWCALTVLAFWLSNLIINLNLVSFVNSTPLPFFYICALYFFLRSYRPNVENSLLLRFAAYLILGMATQLHGSTWVLIFSLFMFDFMQNKNVCSAFFKSLGVSGAGLALPILPFALANYFQNANVADATMQGLGTKIFTLIQWQINLYLQEQPTLLSTTIQFFKEFYYAILLHILFLPFYLYARYRSGFLNKTIIEDKILCQLLWVIAFANIGNFFIFTQQQYLFRYATAFIMSLIGLLFIYTIPLFKKMRFISPGLNYRYSLSLVAALIIFGINVFGLSRSFVLEKIKHDVSREGTTQAMHYAWQLTGWGYQTLSKRLSLVNIWSERDFRVLYNDAINRSSVITKQNNDIDGFIILPSESNDFSYVTQLIIKNLPTEIKDLISTGQLQWVAPKKFDNTWMVPYSISEKAGYDNLHNFGFSYRQYDELTLLEGDLQKPSGSQQIGADEVLFYWNPSSQLQHRTGLRVRFQKDHKLEFLFLGLPLSQNSRWTQPEWTESWQDIRAYVTCDQKTKELNIASGIGNMYHIIKNKNQTGLLAPFTRTIESGCHKTIKKIELVIGTVHLYGLGYTHQVIGERRAQIEID